MATERQKIDLNEIRQELYTADFCTPVKPLTGTVASPTAVFDRSPSRPAARTPAGSAAKPVALKP